mmetsp:Transcript_112110/g.316839  ORF Transcript_112110/g.316839 Transcript_112110/m.316839 type:complete len:273 (-) Transcript_112110:401-1219(-)
MLVEGKVNHQAIDRVRGLDATLDADFAAMGLCKAGPRARILAGPHARSGQLRKAGIRVTMRLDIAVGVVGRDYVEGLQELGVFLDQFDAFVGVLHVGAYELRFAPQLASHHFHDREVLVWLHRALVEGAQKVRLPIIGVIGDPLPIFLHRPGLSKAKPARAERVCVHRQAHGAGLLHELGVNRRVRCGVRGLGVDVHAHPVAAQGFLQTLDDRFAISFVDGLSAQTGERALHVPEDVLQRPREAVAIAFWMLARKHLRQAIERLVAGIALVW